MLNDGLAPLHFKVLSGSYRPHRDLPAGSVRVVAQLVVYLPDVFPTLAKAVKVLAKLFVKDLCGLADVYLSMCVCLYAC